MSPPIPPRTELEKAVSAAVDREMGELRSKIAKLEATDRKHSNTHHDLASNVNRSLEEAREARSSASAIKADAAADLLAAFQIVERRIETAERRADDRADALAREIAALKRAAATSLATTNHAATAAASAAVDTGIIIANQRSEARWATARRFVQIVVLPIVVAVATVIAQHCQGSITP